MLSVSLMGQASTQDIHAEQLREFTVSTLWTFNRCGQTFVHISQFVHVSSFRSIFVILKMLPRPINAPYGHRKRHQKFLKNKERIKTTIINFNAKPPRLKNKRSILI